MMNKLFLSLVYFFSFVFLLVVFLPKQELYYLLLKELNKNEIVLDEKYFSDTNLGLKIEDTQVYIKGIKASNIENITLDTFLFFNKLQIKDIKISENFKQFVPAQIDNVSVVYSVMNPLFVDISFRAKEYKGNGFVDIINRKIIINLYPSNKFIRSYSMLLRNMKKINAKEYRYEYSF
mgnify:CR=1 FL=1